MRTAAAENRIKDRQAGKGLTISQLHGTASDVVVVKTYAAIASAGGLGLHAAGRVRVGQARVGLVARVAVVVGVDGRNDRSENGDLHVG
jgi:hypothetical protein